MSLDKFDVVEDARLDGCYHILQIREEASVAKRSTKRRDAYAAVERFERIRELIALLPSIEQYLKKSVAALDTLEDTANVAFLEAGGMNALFLGIDILRELGDEPLDFR